MKTKIFENPTAVQLLAVHLPFYKSGINAKITANEAIKALEQTKEVTKVFADNLHDTIMLPKIIKIVDQYRQNMLKSLDQICDVVNNEKKDTISCLIQNLIHE